MKIGYASFSFPKEMPVEEAIRTVAELGFDGIEISAWSGYQTDVERLSLEDWVKIGRLANEAGLAVNAIGCHAAYLDPDQLVRKDRVERTKRCVDAAVRVRAPVVDTLSGPLHKELSRQDAWQILTMALGEVVDYAEERGVFIGFEPHVGNFVYPLETILELLETIPSKNLGITFDQSHFAIQGWNIGAALEQLKECIVHVHVKDVRGRFPNHQFLIPGEGDFPFEEFLLDLRKIEYDGFVTAEVSLMRSSRPSYDPYEAASLTYRTLSRILGELGLRGI